MARMTRLVSEASITSMAMAERAARLAVKDGVSIGRALERSGIEDAERRVAGALASSLHAPLAGAGDLVADSAPPLLTPQRCRSWRVFPLGVSGRSLRLAMVDPLDLAAIQDVEFATGLHVLPIVTTETHLLAALDARDNLLRNSARDFDRLPAIDPAGIAEVAEDLDVATVDLDQATRDSTLAPVVRLVNSVLTDAARAGASDIHIEPQETRLLVRFRVDGMLHDSLRIPRHLQDAVISRMKILAGMDISERRKPQDGRSRLRIGGKSIDLRLSTLPAQFGEKVVIRLLSSVTSEGGLEDTGLAGETLQRFRKLISRPQGLILVTGPTGSGKTTTLHAALREIRSPEKNIVTLEDPVEYRIAGLNQVQVNPRAGVTFASGLRSILRQDPNVVLVGEIRDQETGGIVLEAAQTGHLLLSTLHANDAVGSIARLIDLGLEPFGVAAALSGVLAQRLVRVPCPSCSGEGEPTAEVLAALDGHGLLPENGRWMRIAGCESCRQSGYGGRRGIHELLVVDDALREAIVARTAEHLLREAGRAAGMTSLLEDGLAKAARGLTTLEEVLRVAPLNFEREAHADLPESAETEPSPTLGAATVPPAQELTVLVVDDSQVELTVVRYFLEAAGHRVVTASDGASGLEEARRHQPDVIVSDIDMPCLNGLEFVRQLRANALTASAAIILLTSDAREATELTGLANGADDFLNKPVNPSRLKARIQAILARRSMHACVPA